LETVVSINHTMFFVFAGDQVLEYNGIVLTGKTFEEVQRITSQPNGEIELVIKACVLPFTTTL